MGLVEGGAGASSFAARSEASAKIHVERSTKELV